MRESELTWCCRFKCSERTSEATQVQMLGSVIAFKVQNWPPCVLEVYLWPIAVREKTNIGSDSRRNKRQEFKDVTVTERNVSRRKSGNGRMETLDLRQSLAPFSIHVLAPCSTDILKIPETDTRKCLFYSSLWKETPVKKGLWWTVNTKMHQTSR